jgi:hypothetical protein
LATEFVGWGFAGCGRFEPVEEVRSLVGVCFEGNGGQFAELDFIFDYRIGDPGWVFAAWTADEFAGELVRDPNLLLARLAEKLDHHSPPRDTRRLAKGWINTAEIFSRRVAYAGTVLSHHR